MIQPLRPRRHTVAIPGGEAQTIALGPTAVELTGAGDWIGHVRTRFGAFCSQAAPTDFTIEHETVRPCPAALYSPIAIHREKVDFVTHSWGFELAGETFHGLADLGAQRAWIQGPCALFPLDEVLSHLLPHLLEPGLILHGAALTAGDRSWIASGPSGAGKSTLARLVGDHALCDERVFARLDDSGPTIWSLPYAAARPGSARLEGIFLLRHGARHHRRRVSPREGLRRLSSQILWPESVPSACQPVLDRLTELVTTVPIWDLAFTPTPDVWQFITGERGLPRDLGGSPLREVVGAGRRARPSVHGPSNSPSARYHGD